MKNIIKMMISVLLLSTTYVLADYVINDRVISNLEKAKVPKPTLDKISELKGQQAATKDLFLNLLSTKLSKTEINKKVSRKLTVLDVTYSHADSRIDEELADGNPDFNPLKEALGEEAYNKAMASGEYGYTGNLKCRVCHRDFFMGRKKDAHVFTFRKHLAKNFADESKCLTCHTTGFNIPTGFVDKKSTKKLKDVSCEGCHGPGSKHNDLGKAGGFLAGTDSPDVLKKMCVACHTERWNKSYSDIHKAYDHYKQAETAANKR